MQDDAQQMCSGVDVHGGRVQECLRERRSEVSYDCQAELFRQDQEDSEDLRLSVRLFHKCLNDKIQVSSYMSALLCPQCFCCMTAEGKKASCHQVSEWEAKSLLRVLPGQT